MTKDDLISRQPKRTEERTETHSCDCISRQAAIDALNKLKIYRPLDSDRYVISDCLNKIVNLPSAQPEHTNSWYINSWCIDCKEYDTENKCCPRYNMVIKQTLDDAYMHGETEAEARFHDEIVRCKDCKHWREGTVYSYCDRLYGMGVLDIYDYMVAEDDYCSMAERRTDGIR